MKWGLSGWLDASTMPVQGATIWDTGHAHPLNPQGIQGHPGVSPLPGERPILGYSPGVRGGQTLSVVWAQSPPYQMKLLHFPAFRSISCEPKAKLQTQKAGPYLCTP